MPSACPPSGRKRPPYPVPILRLARPAVDRAVQGQGIGRLLLRHCFELAERMREELGCGGLLVDARPASVQWYRAYGFEEIDALEGETQQRPRPVLMFLPLSAVPRPREP